MQLRVRRACKQHLPPTPSKATEYDNTRFQKLTHFRYLRYDLCFSKVRALRLVSPAHSTSLEVFFGNREG